MNVTYAISFEDYRAIQPPFAIRAGHNAGFKGVLVACSLMVLLGVFCIAKGLGVSTGGFLIGLGICSAALAYFFDMQSVSKKREGYERNLAASYQRIHCRDHRTLEADDNGLTLTCRCGTVSRPWSEFVRFSENSASFFLGTKTEAHVVPKSAFSSESDITEFRAFFLERLDAARSITSRPIEFSYKPQDFRDARILHVTRGGGWRKLIGSFATVCVSTYGLYVIGTYAGLNRDPALLSGLIGGLLSVPLLRTARLQRRFHLGSQRIYFSEQGLLLQDPGTVARNDWSQFMGYLEGKRVFLLYYNPRAYRIIPRRALSGWEAAFLTLLTAKLKRYDYRHSATRS